MAAEPLAEVAAVPAQEPPAHGHTPYVPASQSPRELTVRAVVLGAILGIIFAASSVYLALKVGLTVSASIPIAVLSITIFRAFGRATILENNIVQTTGSAGESIAAGVAFTLPALLLMGYPLAPGQVLIVSLLGGLLGVLMMIPLRHGLIVKEHGTLTYPEGTACAEVLVVGEQGGTNARTVFTGFGIGAVYKLLSAGLRFWQEAPERALSWFKGASVGAEISPELLGVGYIIGPRISAVMLAGGVLGYLIIMPMIMLFGGHLTEPLYPAHIRIALMDSDALRKNYVLYIGAGAVATGGMVSLIKAFPTIVGAFGGAIKTFRGSRNKSGASAGSREVPRTERDMPLTVVLFGSLMLVGIMWLTPSLHINLASALLIILFGFFFVTVSSRITGEIGSSSNPISGMTVATLLITCLLFLAVGWTGVNYRSMALVTAAIVCVAASNGGTTSQDLKTGYLVGATPRSQQISLLVGVVTSALVIGFTLLLLNRAYTSIIPEDYPGEHVTPSAEAMRGPDGQTYFVGYVAESDRAIPAGQYLVDRAGTVHYVIDPGIGGRYAVVRPHADEVLDETQRGPDREIYHVGVVHRAVPDAPAGRYLVDAQRQIHFRLDGATATEIAGRHATKLTAPKAQLFALIIDGILTRKLPWGLVLVGVMIAFMMELCGIASLPFAVGLYLPLSTSVPIMAGGMVRWAVDRKRAKLLGPSVKPSASDDSESSPGTLLSSGYIAGGAIAGLAVAAIAGAGLDERFNLSRLLGALSQSDSFAIGCFTVLALWLYRVGVQGQSATGHTAGAGSTSEGEK